MKSIETSKKGTDEYSLMELIIMYFSICDVDIIDDTANITMGAFSFDLPVDDKIKFIADKKYDGNVKTAITDMVNDAEDELSDAMGKLIKKMVMSNVELEYSKS